MDAPAVACDALARSRRGVYPAEVGEAGDDTEQRIREKHAAGDLDGAVTLAIRRYGPELLGFLVALHRDREAARDLFAVVAERIWMGLPRFAWASAFRTWAFSIARNGSRDARRHLRAAPREVPLSICTALSEIEEQERAVTAEYLRTETKDRFAAIRQTLPPEDQELLILRVDKKLSWTDLARGLADDPSGLEGDALALESARLRKRVQSLKERLLELARREGLVPPPGQD